MEALPQAEELREDELFAIPCGRLLYRFNSENQRDRRYTSPDLPVKQSSALAIAHSAGGEARFLLTFVASSTNRMKESLWQLLD
jgi:hypothetical protein